MSSPISDLPDLTGEIIDNGSLHLLRCLGSGGSGVVYLAVDANAAGTPKEYAVKCMIKFDPLDDQNFAQIRELALHIAVSDHPNIISIHRIIYDERYLFVVMDLCEAGDLYDAILIRGVYRNNDELVKLAFTKLIDAVAACHNDGIYHRDIKPENILCSQDGSELWLADFGIATTNIIIPVNNGGTTYYMSPECHRNEYSRRGLSPEHCDIWALGIILLNFLTSSNPWLVAHPSDGDFANFFKEPDYLRTLFPAISIEANALLRRILVMNPYKRISLDELRKEVVQISTFFTTDCPPVTSNSCSTACSSMEVITPEPFTTQGEIDVEDLQKALLNLAY